MLLSPSESVDYAVMEGAKQLVVMPIDPGWSDVGGWTTLYESADKDEHGNGRMSCRRRPQDSKVTMTQQIRPRIQLDLQILLGNM